MSDDTPDTSDTSTDNSVSISRRALLVAGMLGAAGTVMMSSLSQEGHRKTPPTKMNQTPSPNAKPGRNRARYAKPGEVASALETAANSPSSVVKLHPEAIYDPTKTWAVRPGVTLDYNGASVQLSKDIDIHHIHPGGCVERPIVDVRSVSGGFSSSVFRFDSKQYGFYGENRLWHVRGGFTRGRKGEGTLYKFVQGNRNAIYFVHADHAVWNIGTVVEMRREDMFGINGNRIHGLWYGFETGIHMYNRRTPDRAVDNISGNHFDIIAQPNQSKILWDMEAGHYNLLRGRLWDFSKYKDAMWRIHDENATKRIGNILHWFPVGGRKAELLDGGTSAGLFDDRLGDDRNRIVVPWFQGEPVGKFTG